MDPKVLAALTLARAYMVPLVEDTHYGFFPGGDFDPRDFTPDGENTPEEHAAHKAACEAWDRGERPEIKRSGRIEVVTIPALPERTLPGGEVVPASPEHTGPAICCGGSLGPGAITYRDPDALAAVAAIDEAFAVHGIAPPVESYIDGAIEFDAAVTKAQDARDD